MPHLDAIQARHKKSALRDLAFTVGVGVVTYLSLSTLTTAVAAAATLAR